MKRLSARLQFAKPLSQFQLTSVTNLSKRFTLFVILVFMATAGFAQAPAISSFSPASGPVGTLVTINGNNLNLPTALTIGGQNAIVISNTGSVLVGMVMPGAITGLVSITTAAGSASAATVFTVSATPFPSALQGPSLVGTGVNGNGALQGNSVAVSADGNTAIVGGPADNSYQGATWVYTRSGGIWSQQGAKLVGAGGQSFAEQGTSVAVSADGNTALVGAPFDNNMTGAVFVFSRTGTTWTQQGPKLAAFDTVGQSRMGHSVSLSADGNTAIVGGYNDNNNKGAAWIFTRNMGVWAQQGPKLVNADSTGSLGGSVSISSDGNTAIAGAPSGKVAGAVVYTRSGSTWSQQGPVLTLQPYPTGDAVALSADGNTAMVSRFDVFGVYTRNSGTWSQQAAFYNHGGASLSLSADGNTAVIGDIHVVDTFPELDFSYGAWVFTRSNGVWTQQGPESGIGWGAGNSTAVSADGTTVIVGANQNQYNVVTPTGTAYVLVSGPPAPTIQATNVKITKRGPTNVSLKWTNGNGTARAVFISRYGEKYPAPYEGITYAADTVYGAGDHDYLYSFCVYNGTDSTVNVTGLFKNAEVGDQWYASVVEYNSAANSPRYLNTHGVGNPVVFYPPLRNDTLKNLLTSSGSLTPAFSPGTTSYTKSVGNTVTTITFTPIVQDTTARVTVNGIAVKSGTASPPVALATGSNAVPIVVTAPNGATLTYTVTVNRALSADATLSNLSVSPGTIKPAFVATTTVYAVAVGNGVTSITVTPTTTDTGATVKVKGVAVASGTASGPINLVVGANTIAIKITAQNGVTIKNYQITVTRAASSNAKLLTLNTNHGGLTPSFNNTVYSYSKAVGNAVTSITFSPTTVDKTATVTVNGTTVASGSPSAAIALNVGDNPVAIKVIAGDGVTTLTYTITVTRAAGPMNAFYEPVSVATPLDNLQVANDGINVRAGISPNGDGINDFLVIENIANYPDNKLQILNRSGQLIFEAKNYDNSTNVFDGHSNKTGEKQLPGTYFYSLDYTVKGVARHKTGYIVLKY